MLLSFGAKNFFCFKEWCEISLELNSKVPEAISRKSNVTHSLCLKGGNASGKTNAIKIIAFISYFCTNSFQNKPDEEILVNSFFENDKPVDLFIKFNTAGIEYNYELSLTKKIIISEKLYKKTQRKTLVLSRNTDQILINRLFNTKPAIAVRKNASIISSANQYDISEIKPIYSFLQSIRSNVSRFGRFTEWFEPEMIPKFYSDNHAALQFTTKYLQMFDTGIKSVSIETTADHSNPEKKIYYPIFTHFNESESAHLPYQTESSGTKSLFELLPFYRFALDTGGVLALDEFDIYLHPDILSHLISLFENESTNPNHAQLIFSTHNSQIIDIMGKYKTYLFNKENGESYCYRLDELSNKILRNDRPITPLYNAGEIGGVPRINGVSKTRKVSPA